jgi:tetratricopeptide (TPR) repeat protein
MGPTRGETMFDLDEYFHLALHASSVGQHGTCMTYLKEVLKQQPRNAPALYLLAAQHAEIGMLERAVSGIKAALAIEPGLEIARFQLGLLLLDSQRRSEAKENFAGLSGSADAALRLFSDAMIALSDEDRDSARRKLDAGLAQPGGNPALRSLMQRVLGALAQNDAATLTAPEPPDARIRLGAYGQVSP